MRFLQSLLILGLIVAVGMAYRQLQQIETNNSQLLAGRNGSATRSNSISSVTPKSNRDTVSSSQNFAALVNEEAQTISQLTENPEDIEKRLNDLAGKMQESDVPALQESALDTKLNGDQRFLAVYILGKSALPRAQESLEAIATTPIPTLQEARLVNQEEIIRGQAVESLRKPESLKRVLAQSDNTFINDRAQRNLLHQEGKASSPEQQDQSALERLLRK